MVAREAGAADVTKWSDGYVRVRGDGIPESRFPFGCPMYPGTAGGSWGAALAYTATIADCSIVEVESVFDGRVTRHRTILVAEERVRQTAIGLERVARDRRRETARELNREERMERGEERDDD